jgi:transposase
MGAAVGSISTRRPWWRVCCSPAEQGQVQRELRTFGTMTADLLALADWLEHWQITHVAMEATGVYWRPVYNLLEDETPTLVLVNPQHIKAVPGRKTEVKDAEWLADSLRVMVWSRRASSHRLPFGSYAS